MLTACWWPAVSTRAATIPGTFTQINNDGGGWFSGFAIHSNGRVYGRTDVGGLYRSDDHGSTWTYLSGDFTSHSGHFVQGVAISPTNADVVYQCLGTSYDGSAPERGIWMSTDGGASWVQVKSGINFSGNDEPRWGGECIVIHPADSNEIWVGSRAKGLWKSLDAGGTWTQVAAATFGSVVISTICVHPSFPDQIWVAGEGGVWVSTNRGSTWTQKQTLARVWRVVRKSDGTTFINGGNANPGSTTDVKLLRVSASDWANPATYTFTDTWQNWLNAHEAANGWKPVEYNPGLTVLADGSIVAGSIFQAWGRSTNNGSSWSMLPITLTGRQPAWQYSPTPAEYTGGSNQIAQDPTQASRWFLTGGYGPLRTEDSGASWRYITNGVGEMVTWRVRFHPTDASKVYLPLADMGMCVVSDGGASGASAGFIMPHFPWPDDNVLFSHRPLISGTGRIIAAGGEQSTHQARIYLSNNHGATWTKIAFSGLPTGNNREIVDAVASTDNADDILVAVGGSITSTIGGVYRSTNAGSSFMRCAGLPVGFDCGNEFWWHPRLETDAADVNKRYLALRGNGFWRSTDRGATWTKPAGQPNENYGMITADPATGGRLWYYHSDGLETSTNGGDSWSSVSGFIATTAADCVNGRIAVLGRRTGDTFDKIYYSASNGTTWDEITRPGKRFGHAQAVAVDPHRPGCVWISTNGRSVAKFAPGSDLSAWRQQHFGTTENTGNVANDVDFDHDGETNLAEYAVGTDPTQASSVAPARAIVQASGGADHLVLRVTRAQKRADVSYVAEVSGNMQSWVSTGVTVVTDTATLLEVIDDTALTPGARRFMRLRIVAQE
jgi:hypothetical protein